MQHPDLVLVEAPPGSQARSQPESSAAHPVVPPDDEAGDPRYRIALSTTAADCSTQPPHRTRNSRRPGKDSGFVRIWRKAFPNRSQESVGAQRAPRASATEQCPRGDSMGTPWVGETPFGTTSSPYSSCPAKDGRKDHRGKTEPGPRLLIHGRGPTITASNQRTRRTALGIHFGATPRRVPCPSIVKDGPRKTTVEDMVPCPEEPVPSTCASPKGPHSNVPLSHVQGPYQCTT